MLSSPLLTKIQELISPQIAKLPVKILGISIYRGDLGLVLNLEADPLGLNEDLLSLLPKIAGITEKVCPLHSVQINNGAPIEVAGMRLWSLGAFDLACEEQDELKTLTLQALCKFLLGEASISRSVFEITSGGVYLSAVLRLGSTPPMPPDELVGKRLCETVGEEAEAVLLKAIQKSIATGREVLCNYSAKFAGDRTCRHYEAKIAPSPRGNCAFVSVARIFSDN